ncbi:MAG: GIY-YIG nuclease family protein [Patescibacteria group bacterium]
MFYVYVLKSRRDGRLYIGSTNNLPRRLDEHNQGRVKSTRPRMPLDLVYYEAYLVEEDARVREGNLKLGSRALAQLKRRLVETLKLKESS